MNKLEFNISSDFMLNQLSDNEFNFFIIELTHVIDFIKHNKINNYISFIFNTNTIETSKKNSERFGKFDRIVLKNSFFSVCNFSTKAQFTFYSIYCNFPKQVHGIEFNHLTNYKSDVSKYLISKDDIGYFVAVRSQNNDFFDEPKSNSCFYLPFKHLLQEITMQFNLKKQLSPKGEKFNEFRKNYYNKFESTKLESSCEYAPFHEVIKPLKEFHNLKARNNEYLIEWGTIIAILNNCKFSADLTKINSINHRVNSVFVSNLESKIKYFFSIDTENGNLEIYDKNGNHVNLNYGIQSGLRKLTKKCDYTIKVK